MEERDPNPTKPLLCHRRGFLLLQSLPKHLELHPIPGTTSDLHRYLSPVVGELIEVNTKARGGGSTAR